MLFFFSVLNSGHMVPMDVPKEALDMIKRFLSGNDFSAGSSMLGVSLVNVEDAEHCIAAQNAGVKRGGGTSDESTLILKKDAANAIFHSKNHLANLFSSLFGFQFSKGGSSYLAAIVILFILVLLVAVIFFLRFQRLNKQFISRR